MRFDVVGLARTRSSENTAELVTRLDIELAVNLAQVICDGVGTDIELCCNRTVCVALGGELCNLKLLGSELVARVVNAGPCVLAGGPELGFGAPSKSTTANGQKAVTGGPQLLSRLGAAPLAPEPLSVQETCSG